MQQEETEHQVPFAFRQVNLVFIIFGIVVDSQVAAGFQQPAPLVKALLKPDETDRAFGPEYIERLNFAGDVLQVGLENGDAMFPFTIGDLTAQFVQGGTIDVEGDDFRAGNSL